MDNAEFYRLFPSLEDEVLFEDLEKYPEYFSNNFSHLQDDHNYSNSNDVKVINTLKLDNNNVHSQYDDLYAQDDDLYAQDDDLYAQDDILNPQYNDLYAQDDILNPQYNDLYAQDGTLNPQYNDIYTQDDMLKPQNDPPHTQNNTNPRRVMVKKKTRMNGPGSFNISNSNLIEMKRFIPPNTNVCGDTAIPIKPLKMPSRMAFLDIVHNIIPASNINQYCLEMINFILKPYFPIAVYSKSYGKISEPVHIVDVVLHKQSPSNKYELLPVYYYKGARYKKYSEVEDVMYENDQRAFGLRVTKGSGKIPIVQRNVYKSVYYETAFNGEKIINELFTPAMRSITALPGAKESECLDGMYILYEPSPLFMPPYPKRPIL